MELRLTKLPKANNQKQVEIWFEKVGEIKDDNAKKFAESIFSNSPYLSSLIAKNTEFFLNIFKDGFELSFKNILSDVEASNIHYKAMLMEQLRIAKQKAALLIAMGEISELWSMEDATAKLSTFADLCIKKAVEHILVSNHNRELIKLVDPKNPFYQCGLTVIALGKLGSDELNYSSDVDLSFFFEEDKLEYKGKKTLQIFYIDLVKEVIDIFSKPTSDGYVFRCDVRLRPDPASNPVAVSLTKAENYYFTVGQNWERAAMIKARDVAGDSETAEIFHGFNARNVWRRSLDFETIEDIHSIKRQIDSKQGFHAEDLYGYNLKLGLGGIREVEFFCQTQQLIWGGRKPVLRNKKTLRSLENLCNEGEISEQARDEMSEAYKFYRKVEHRLQMVNDEQTHSLPKNAERMLEIAVFCGFEDIESFKSTLQNHIKNIRSNYSKLFESSPTLAIEGTEIGGSLVFTGIENHPSTLETLSNLGYCDANKISDIVRGWHHGRYDSTKKKRSRAVLTKLMPQLISSFSKATNADLAFTRFDEFLARVPEGSQIFSLLFMNPSIMDLLAEILSDYQQLALSLIKNPTLLDYVLAPEFYNSIPNMEYLVANLEENISTNANNIDDIFEVIKDWANDRKFRVGIQLLREEVTTEDVFYGLSSIAEVVILTLQKYIKKDFIENFGDIEGGKFAVLAFGKLGSSELTFNSDIDIVFIYDYPDQVFSAKNSDLNPSSYYIRMANKVVYALSSISRTGKLYEVDLRLRPLGDSGPIATPLKSFDEYYNPERIEGSAWIWEYMALTRARVITNDKNFKDTIDEVIKTKIFVGWQEDKLYEQVKYIHEKFRETKKPKNELDLKKSVGGIFDLEFMLRFLQLKNLNKYPEIYSLKTIDTINLLGIHGILERQDVEELRSAYEFYKDAQNILRITSEVKITKNTKKLLSQFFSLKNYSEVEKILEFHKNQVINIFEKYMGFK